MMHMRICSIQSMIHSNRVLLKPPIADKMILHDPTILELMALIKLQTAINNTSAHCTLHTYSAAVIERKNTTSRFSCSFQRKKEITGFEFSSNTRSIRDTHTPRHTHRANLNCSLNSFCYAAFIFDFKWKKKKLITPYDKKLCASL